MEAFFHAQSVEFLLVVPLAQTHDQIDLLSLADGSNPEELANVEYAQTSNLDVMSKKVRGATEDDPGWPPVAADDVIGDQPVTAHHELERALAFADPAFALEQNADPVDIHEHPVQLRVRRKPIVEHRVQRVDGSARSGVGDEEGSASRLGCGHEGPGRIVSAGDEDARQAEREKAACRDAARFAVERIQVRQFGLTENLDAGRHDSVEVTGERQPVFLHTRVPEGTIEACFSRQPAHVKGELRIVDELSHRELRNGLALCARAARLLRHGYSPPFPVSRARAEARLTGARPPRPR